LRFTQVTAELISQKQRVTVNTLGSGEFGGTFSISLLSNLTRGISVDAAANHIEGELSYSLGLEAVRVVPVDLGINSAQMRPVDLGTTDQVTGNYRCWDIEFVSVGGQVPLIGCDVSGVRTLPGDEARCMVKIVRSATSTALGGSFVVTKGGARTSSLPVSISSSAMRSALALLPLRDVSVSRRSLEPDGSYEWLVTYRVNDGDTALIGIDSSQISGTNSAVEITSVQRGSYLDGTFPCRLAANRLPPLESTLHRTMLV